MINQKKYTLAFFFRRINDLNQFIPLINFFIKKRKNIILICLDTNFLIKDYKPLKKYFKSKYVTINYLNSFLEKKKIFDIKIFNFFKKKTFLNKKKLKNFLEKYNISKAIFDFPITNQNYRELMKTLTNYNIKIIGIHHGIWVRCENMNTHKTKNFFKSQLENSKIYDKIFVFNPEFKKNLEILGCKKKIFFPGSILYAKENIKKLNIKKNNIINLLYLDHSSKHGINKKIVIEDLYKLSKLNYIELKIRPNTSIQYRNNLKDMDIFVKKGLNNNITFDDTSKLIQESDIIINPISSSIIEAFYFKKIIIHPKHYIKNDYLLWQKFKSCYEVNSYDEIIKIINLFNSKKLKTKKYFFNCKKTLRYLNTSKNLNYKLNYISNKILDE
jgi:hypothetical protein